MKKVVQIQGEVDVFQDNLELFWKMITERHKIYVKRNINKEEAPWTKDFVFKNFKFTNVFRELDRGTRYVTDKILPNTESDYCNALFHVMMYRIFNKIETLEAIYSELGVFDYEEYEEDIISSICDKVALDGKVFTNAFVVSGYSHLPKDWNKIKRVAHILTTVKEAIMDSKDELFDILIKSETMEDIYNWVLGIKGFGPFLSYQIAVDMSYTTTTGFHEDEFVVCGPGCKRGIELIFPEEVVKQYGHESLNFHLRNTQHKCLKKFGYNAKELFADRELPYLTVMSIENCLCEFQKYHRTFHGLGKPKNGHNGNESQYRRDYTDYNSWWDASRKPFNVYNKIQQVISKEETNV